MDPLIGFHEAAEIDPVQCLFEGPALARRRAALYCFELNISMPMDCI
jgi:hypothetical protein